MKYLISVVGILLASCSSIKIEEQIVQDFVREKDLKNSPNTSPTFLIEESDSIEKSLHYYEMAYLDKNISLEKKRVDVLPSNFNSWPIDINEVNKLNYKNNNLSYSWSSKKFNSLGIPIIKRKDLEDKIAKQNLPLTSSGTIISKPIVTANKKYALFYYYSLLSMSSISKKVCLVEKVNNKWVIKAEFYDPNVFN